MFTISKFENLENGVYIEIHCQFITSELIIEKKLCPNIEASQRFFNYIASDFLSGQIEEFLKVIEFIKPNYFDKTSIPYMQLSNDWRKAYFDFKMELLPKLSKDYFMPGNYAKHILKFQSTLKDLVSTLPVLGKAELNHMYHDIIKCAKMISESLDKMKNNDFKQYFNKTA